MTDSVTDVIADILEFEMPALDRAAVLASAVDDWRSRLRVLTTNDERRRDLRAAREQLGWSQYQMADALELSGTTEKGAQRVRQMENGSREISGPVAVAVRAFVEGYRPREESREAPPTSTRHAVE